LNTTNTVRTYLVTGGDGNTRKQLRRALERKGMKCVTSRDPPGFTVDVPEEEDEFVKERGSKLRGEDTFDREAMGRQFSWAGRLTFQEIPQLNAVTSSLILGQKDSAPISRGEKVVFSLGEPVQQVQKELLSAQSDEPEPELGEYLTLDQFVKAARRKGSLSVLALCAIQELIEAFMEKKGKKRLLDGYPRIRLIEVARAKGGDQTFLHQLELSRLLETVMWREGREFLLDQISVGNIVLAVENAVQRVEDQTEKTPDQEIAAVLAPARKLLRASRTRPIPPDVLRGEGNEYEPGDELTAKELVDAIRRNGILRFLAKLTFNELASALKQEPYRDRVFEEFTIDELIEITQERGGEQEFLDQFDLSELIRAFLARGGKDYFLERLRLDEFAAVAEYKIAQLRKEKAQLKEQKDEATFGALERIEAKYAPLRRLQSEEDELLRRIQNIQ